MSLLMLTTLVSLAVAAVASGIAWRLWQESRARAAARTRALEQAIIDATDSCAADRRPPESADAVLATSSADQALFASTFSSDPLPRRLAPVLGLGVIVTGVAAALFVVASSLGTATEAPAVAPIELLSMRHVTEYGDFVITGLVRNPEGSEARQGISAVAFLFDDRGGFITTVKAPIDLALLSPGDESAFQLKLPRPADLERYRLSFRTADGAVLPHLDRREAQ